jgi:hypothetical protein
MLTHQETQTTTIEQISEEARKLVLLKMPKLIKRSKDSAHK